MRPGSYEIVAAIGPDGMGEVYRARDTGLERDVALTVLPARIAADTERLPRFEQEVRAAGALSHPNILSIHDIGREHLFSLMLAERVFGIQSIVRR